MPKVIKKGKVKKFSYTAKGKKQAKKFAKKTGEKLFFDKMMKGY